MAGTSNELARKEPLIVQIIQSPGMMQQIKAALPALGVTAERMCRMALTCLRNTPKLQECDQHSILAGIVQLAQLGLEPSTPLGHAWLIPFGSKCQVVIGYKGFIALADRAGITLGAEVVYERDRFTYPRPGETVIDYVPFDGDGEKDDRGERRYSFAYAMRAGRPLQFKVCTRRDIMRARAASSAVKNGKKDSPWFGDERGVPDDVDAMWRKTAIRRIAPFLPLSSEHQTRFADAIALDQQAELGVAQMFDLSSEEVKTETKVDQLETRLRESEAATSAAS